MTPRLLVLNGLLSLMIVMGIMDGEYASRGLPEPILWKLASGLLFSFLCFYWYRRSPWLSVGVVALAMLAIPYYLLRSRPAGERGRALARLLGFFCLMGVAAAAGLLIHTALA